MNTEISVIIPTCGRNESLSRSLAALERQTLSGSAFEVIVVVDGAEPDALAMLKNYRGALRLRFSGLPSSGAGTARNKGAELALGRILLFLDDDIEADAGLLSAHLRTAAGGDCVGIGNLVTLLPSRPGFLGIGMRIWWERKMAEMRRAGHRFSYVDLLSGHFSVSAKTFVQIGGFDTTMNCREDYEFGIRLIQANVPFRFVKEAGAVHHETVSLRKNLRRAMNEGFADTGLARRYPELIPDLPATNFCDPGWKPSSKKRLAEKLISQWPRLAESLLNLAEWFGLRAVWQRLYLVLRKHWYLLGVCAACPSAADRSRLFVIPAAAAAKIIPTIDLKNGMAEAGVELDKIQPQQVRICYGQFPVGTIEAKPLAENIGARHLFPFVRDHCSQFFLTAVAFNRIVNSAKANDNVPEPK
jgi:GT2 family glycosyltransferase